jgi:hypothetical protein
MSATMIIFFYVYWFVLLFYILEGYYLRTQISIYLLDMTSKICAIAYLITNI